MISLKISGDVDSHLSNYYFGSRGEDIRLWFRNESYYKIINHRLEDMLKFKEETGILNYDIQDSDWVAYFETEEDKLKFMMRFL